MLNLGVNVDHVATLRQARGTSYPSPVEAAGICAEAGADSITVHLREDRRHIQDDDVHEMMTGQSLPVNLEMANVPEIVELAIRLKPAEVCLVPERRAELTTEGGLDVVRLRDELEPAIARMDDAGIIVSLFVDPSFEQIEASRAIGAPVIELHTGAFCEAEGQERVNEMDLLVKAATRAHKCGLQVNAGHGINLDNIGEILTIPYMDTLNIGHSIVARAVMVGMHAAVTEMRDAMKSYTGI